MLCRRVPSSHPHKELSGDDGWYHFYEANQAVVRPDYYPKDKQPPECFKLDAFGLMLNLRSVKDAKLDVLAERLGVNFIALDKMQAAFFPDKKAWAFPMYDGNGKTVGVRLRNDDGFKWAVAGSQQGLFCPSQIDVCDKIAYLPEGPTDTAALLTMNLCAIGRPNCNGGAEHLKIALERLGIKRIVIVADNDSLKRLGPNQGYPGIEGAQRLKVALKRWPSVIYTTPSPCKDVRSMLIDENGKRRFEPLQARRLIEKTVETMTWTKG